MIQKKVRMSACLIIAASLIPTPLLGESLDSLDYTIENGEITITGFACDASEVIIPNQILGYPVTAIGMSAFRDCATLTSVTLPDGLVTIEGTAFNGCTNLDNIDLPNGLTTIGFKAFGNCINLTSINIPASVENIIEAPFTNCSSLTGIDVSTSNPFFESEDGVLFDEEKQVLRQYPGGKAGDYFVPKEVVQIQNTAFQNSTNLTSVTLPGGLQSLGLWAFSECTNLKSAFFLGPVPIIPDNSVFRNSPATIYYIEGMPGWGAEFAGRPALPFDPDWLWGKYAYVEDGDRLYADTGTWLSWFEVSRSPWVWQTATREWFYITEPVATAERGWIYIANLAFESPNLWLVMMPGSDWGWSYGMRKWLLVREELRQGNGGWVYLQ